MLIPNTELGHLKMGKRQIDAEKRAAELVREREHLSWKKWARRVSDYLEALEVLLWPDLFVIGGGVSASADKFMPRLKCATPVVAAAAREPGRHRRRGAGRPPPRKSEARLARLMPTFTGQVATPS